METIVKLSVSKKIFSTLFLSLCFYVAVFAQPPEGENEKLANVLLSASPAERAKLIEENKSRFNEAFIQILWQRGDARRDKSEFAEALKIYEIALETARSAGNDANGVASSLLRLGAVQRSLGNHAQALSALEEGLKIAGQANNRPVEARILNNIGNVHLTQGELERALAFYERSLALQTELGNQQDISRLHNNIGNVYIIQGNFRLGLESYQKSLEWKEKAGDKAGIAHTLTNMGIVRYNYGNYELALDYYRRSQAIWEELGNRSSLAEVLNNTGNAYRQLGDYEKALDFHRRSLAIKEAIGGKDGIAASNHNIGNVYQTSGDYEKALEFYRRSLALRETLGHRIGIASLLSDIAIVEFESGKRDEAAATARRSLEIARRLSHDDVIWQTLYLLGRYEFTRKNFPAAVEYLNESISVIEAMRGQVAGGERDRQSFFAGKLAPYQMMVEVLVEQGQAKQALAFAERGKARVLLDVLRGGRMNLNQEISAEERDAERKLINEIAALNRQIAAETLPEKIEELKAELQKARLRHSAFETNLYAGHSKLKLQRGITEQISLAEIAELLPDEKTALLEFVTAKDQTYLFVLTKNKAAREPDVKAFQIPVKRAEIQRLVQDYREQLAARRLNFRPAGENLVKLLLAPAGTELKGKNKIIIVPDAELWELPFQALVQPADGGKFLIETAEISYAQSFTVLREMRRANRKQATPQPENLLLAFGNPLNQDANNANLPEAERQTKTLAEIYGASRSRIFTGAQADENAFKTEAGKAKILHLATHGVLDDLNPIYSRLVFSSKNKSEDGVLEAWEIMRMNLSAQLVVLSACETARGKYSAGEGLIGMTWAFFVAGAPTSIVSHWKVEETGTAELMTEFHRRYQIKNQTAAVGVLREAALKMLAERKYSHPFYWAGFVVVGDGR